MIRKLQILCFLISLSFFADAHSYMLGEIYYKHLGNEKYEIKFTFHRDCRGEGFSTPKLTMKCDNTGASKSLYPVLFSIKDVTEICPTAQKPCDPQNTYGTGRGFEEQVYVDTVDFNGVDSAFKSCCTISFSNSECCRNGSISTGGANNNFFVYSKIERCLEKNNSSPFFLNNIQNDLVCNQPLKISFLAEDADGDSLSYNLTDPLTNYSSKISWSGNFNAQIPLTPYYPTGYNKSKGPQPDADPPVGVYFDEQTGMFVTTPSDCNEVTLIAVKVSEWRKDNNGKYNKIGEVTKDMQLFFSSGNNNNPTISGATTVQACEGEKFSLFFYTNDKPYYVPPAKPIYNDTVKLSWYNPIKNSIIKLDSSYTYSKKQAAIFEWTPQKSDISTKPYIFTLKAIDNACTYSGSSYKNVMIKVYPKIKVTSEINKLDSKTFAFKTSIDNKNYPYMITNNVKTDYPYDSRTFYFKSSGTINSDLEQDTVIFLKNGNFIINHFFISQIQCNQQTVSDTVSVNNIMESTITKSADTVLCKNSMSDFRCKVINAKKPITYSWKTKNTTKTDTSGEFSNAFSQPDTIYVTTKDALGKTSITWVSIKISEIPSINAGDDKSACAENSIMAIVKNNNTDTLKWQWTFNKAIASNNDTLIANQSGTYIAWGTNKFFCTGSDTMIRNNFKTDAVSLLSGRYCQNLNLLNQNEIFLNNPNTLPVLQWSTLKPLKDQFGNSIPINKIVFDEDLGSDYKYVLYFGKDLIDLDTLWEDSLKFVVKAWDKNNCFSVDTATISVIKIPEIEFGLPNYSICRDDTVDLNNLVITKGKKSWFPINTSGYEQWPIPVTSEIKNGLIKSKFFNPSGGKYLTELISTYDKCFDKDSFDLIIFSNPIPIVSYVIDKDSIIILDNSLFADYRKWYLNGKAKGTGKILVLSAIEADEKPIKLELGTSNSCFTDTVFTINSVKISGINRNNIKIYPNPATSKLHIEFAKPLKKSNWSIINVTGKSILNGEVTGSESTIDISKLKSGVYYINISNDEIYLSVSFIKTEN